MFHKKCGRKLVVDLRDSIFIAGFVDVKNSESLVATELFLSDNTENGLAISEGVLGKFYCPSCSKFVKEDEIFLFCSYCNERFNINELLVYKTSGIYCEECLQRNDIKTEGLKTVANSLRAVYLR
jgi:hypothetical protein